MKDSRTPIISPAQHVRCRNRVLAALGAATATVTAFLVVVVVGGSAVWADSPTMVSFSYTDAVQTWTVPAGVTSVQVDVRGAKGGGTYGGFGGRVVATIQVSPSDTLYIYVGGQPSGPNPTGFDGGAGGGGSTAGAGGDATDVRLGGMALADRVVVAGGGGGQGQGASAAESTGGSGGSFSVAQAGTAGFCSTSSGGDGGTSSAGGAAGTGGEYGTPAAAGSLGQGGAAPSDNYSGGGGGGGYYGGGGGAGCHYGPAGGGGGGSDFVEATATSVQDFAGYNAGSGSVTVTYPPSSPSSSPSSGTKDFSYTGTPQLWTVPAGVTSVQVDVRGAQGGGTYGGFGGRVVTTVPVIPGQDGGRRRRTTERRGALPASTVGPTGVVRGPARVATPPTCASAVRRWPTGSWWPAVVAARGRGPTRSTALGLGWLVQRRPSGHSRRLFGLRWRRWDQQCRRKRRFWCA